jgi:uncharacterized membrane protein
MPAFALIGCAGCLLPFLIVVNLLFGWIFLSLGAWLSLELLLVLLLLFNFLVSFRRLKASRDSRNKAVDVEAEVID